MSTFAQNALEQFKCERFDAKLSRKACAGNYKIATHKGVTPRGGVHAAGRAKCLGCEIGAAHGRGELIPLERIVRIQAPKSVHRPMPTPAVAAAIVKADVAEHEAPPQPTVVEPPIEPAAEEPPLYRSSLQFRRDHRAAVMADVLKCELPICGYVTKYDVNQATIRYWLERAGHDPKLWPKKQYVRASKAPREKPPAPISTAADERRARILALVMFREKSIGEYAREHGVDRNLLCLWLKKIGQDVTTWPKLTIEQRRQRTREGMGLTPTPRDPDAELPTDHTLFDDIAPARGKGATRRDAFDAVADALETLAKAIRTLRGAA